MGSHIVDALVADGHDVLIIDSLVSGKKENLPAGTKLSLKDVSSDDLLPDLSGVETVFHMAADPDVRKSASEPEQAFRFNVLGTHRVLEACRKCDVRRIVFPSTSTVYGKASVVPTPEAHPCAPISNYGAGKLTCESLLSGFAHTYGMKATVLRYANIFGERSRHGIMFDFFHKLRRDPSRLEVLGDGKQDKSCLHVSDCVSATLLAWKMQEKAFDVFNVGGAEKRTADDIASLVSSAMGLGPELSHTCSGGGWKGMSRSCFWILQK